MPSLARGKPSLLIALPQLQDPNFEKSIVLLLEHDDRGAMGFVINRMSNFTVNEILSDDLELPHTMSTWIGGPVGVERGVIVHNIEDIPSETHYDQVKVSSTPEAILTLSQMNPSTEGLQDLYPYRFLVGYAGWGQRQLEEEIRAGAWIQTEFDGELVFNTPWQNMWIQAIQSLGVNPLDIVSTEQYYPN